jgi:hypothetical protein
MTQSERLYLLFMFSRVPGEKEKSFESLVLICAKALGHLTPVWQGKWNPDFDSLRHKSRVPWTRFWLTEQLKTPQMDLCRYIGRRCRLALIDEIRGHYRKPHPPKPEPVPAEQILEQKQEMMAAFGKWLRHYGPKTELNADEKLLVFDCITTGKPVPNTVFAKQIGRSEGYVRKMRIGLLAKMRRGKKERVEHWERKCKAAAKAGTKLWAKTARRDKTAWWESKAGKANRINTKK